MVGILLPTTDSKLSPGNVLNKLYMSNYLAIATVTATLQRILQSAIQLDLPGARVTTVKPGASGSGIPELGVNIYLYQVTPNPAWRNVDLRTRRPKGDLIKHAQAGLDLYYLMTFYGNDLLLEPERLLGSTMRTLVDQPILTPEMIRATVNSSTYSFLADSTLAEQLERVTIVPSPMTTEDLSKIWSVFFQCPYVLSFAFQGSTVLIDGQKTSGRALPVRSIKFYNAPNQPALEQVMSEAGVNQPIVANSTLIIRGKHLNAEITKEKLLELTGNNPQRRGEPHLKIGEARLALPLSNVTEKQIRLELSSVSMEQKNLLRAGVQGLQIIYPIVPKQSLSEPDRVMESNVMPVVLCPSITARVEVSDLWDDEDDLYSAKVQVQLDLTVGRQQRVMLFLNQRSFEQAAYIFAASPRKKDTNIVVFRIVDVKAGEYLVRVQVDGAESVLEVDTQMESETFDWYIGPMVTIGKCDRD